jgi:hypothetical protein
MSDSVSSSLWGGPEVPSTTFFDPASGPLPEALAWKAGRPETMVLLLSSTGDREWAADAAAAVAAEWARAGRRVVLADLHLEEPVLHERLGEPNLDGVVDVFLYGASLARTARAVAGRGFYLISSGTYTPDPEPVLRHSRWPKIITGFRDAQATLLLFVPAGTPGVESLARAAEAAIVLGEAGPGALPQGVRVRAVVAPPAAAVPEAVPEAAATPEPEPTPRAEEDDGWAELRTRPEPVEVLPAPDPFEERADPLLGEYANGIPATTLPAGAVRRPREPDLTEPPPPEIPVKRRRGGDRKVSPVLWALLAVVVLFAAGYFLLQAYPDLPARMGLGGGVAEAPRAAAPAAPRPRGFAPAPAGTKLPYSVQVKAFASLPAAAQLAATEGQRFSDVPFFVSLELIDSVPYYKVLAGLYPDTAGAARLRERLVQAEVVDADDAQGAWSLIQPTPLAFQLGEFPTRGAAQARADSLLAREVPAYPVAVPYTNGSERWRLYVGAFRDSVAAEGMRRLLADKQVEAKLEERAGRGVRTEG